LAQGPGWITPSLFTKRGFSLDQVLLDQAALCRSPAVFPSVSHIVALGLSPSVEGVSKALWVQGTELMIEASRSIERPCVVCLVVKGTNSKSPAPFPGLDLQPTSPRTS